MLENHRNNSFDALRLIAAWLVICGHGFILAGWAEYVPRVGGVEVSVIGVAIFFAISGYLIWNSWIHRSSWQAFVVARVLRIFPALIAVVFLTVFLLGPLVTALPLGEYFSSSQTYLYLSNSLIMEPQYLLPGVFQGQPFTEAVNGSLWTLRAELLCYVAVPIAALVSKSMRPWVLLAAGVGLVVFGSQTTSYVYGANLSAASFYWGCFALGAFLASAKFSFTSTRTAPIVFLAAWITTSLLLPAQYQPVGVIFLALATIAVGVQNIPVVRNAARFGDFSYGMYLVAFPIQQVILKLAPSLTLWWSIALVTLFSLVCAFVLWHLIEKLALVQKKPLAAKFEKLFTRAKPGKSQS